MSDSVTDAEAVRLCDLADALTDGRLARDINGGILTTREGGKVAVTKPEIAAAIMFAGRCGMLGVTT